jgi:pimeloyl-ACP methyl ester carboxylesterase
MQQQATKAAGFAAETLEIRGVRVQVLTAGAGSPVVYFHGAGTIGGFESLLPLAERHKLYVPVHPGWGESEDDPMTDSVLDYIVHYATLCDRLGLKDQFDLVGHSLGGWMAAMFAVLQGHRVRKLALVCPAGLRVPAHPTIDLFTIPAEQLPPYLVADVKTLERLMPGGVTNEMKLQRYREAGSLARIMWDRNYDPKLERWLDRVSMPTLLLWGEQDRCIPVQQAQSWAKGIAKAEIVTFPNAGHLLFAEAPDAVKRLNAFLN